MQACSVQCQHKQSVSPVLHSDLLELQQLQICVARNMDSCIERRWKRIKEEASNSR